MTVNRYPCQRDVDDYDDDLIPDNETMSLMETPEGQEWEPVGNLERAEDSMETGYEVAA